MTLLEYSPLTANIYFPAIPTLVNAFHKTTELINLTVTVYMIVQGICTLIIFVVSPARPLICTLPLKLPCFGVPPPIAGADGQCTYLA